MPAKFLEIAEGNGVVLVCDGDVVGQEIIDANKEIMLQEDNLRKWLFCLVDHTHAASTNYQSFEVQIMADQDWKMALIMKPGFLVAVVSPEDLQFGMSRMWQALAESTGWEIDVFRGRAEAEAWLRRRVKDKFQVDLPAFGLE